MAMLWLAMAISGSGNGPYGKPDLKCADAPNVLQKDVRDVRCEALSHDVLYGVIY